MAETGDTVGAIAGRLIGITERDITDAITAPDPALANLVRDIRKVSASALVQVQQDERPRGLLGRFLRRG
jgi:phage tail protein X